MAIRYPAPKLEAPTLVFGHGAGAGQGHPWMKRVAAGLATRGVTVVTFDFPYREKGRGAPDPPAVLEAAFASTWKTSAADAHGPLFAGGKSMGGRIASQVAASGGFDPPAAGLVFFGYPLHPPGKPAQRRDRHLPSVGAPMLFLSGTRDPFGSPQELEALIAHLPGSSLELVDGGDHSLVAPKRADPKGTRLENVLDVAAAWILRIAKDSRP